MVFAAYVLSFNVSFLVVCYCYILEWTKFVKMLTITSNELLQLPQRMPLNVTSFKIIKSLLIAVFLSLFSVIISKIRQLITSKV